MKGKAADVRLRDLLHRLKLPVSAEEMPGRLQRAGHADAVPTISEVLDLEADDRHQRKVARLLKTSRLSPTKTLAALDLKRFPRPLAQKLEELVSGAFVSDAMNVLLFGLPGVGKTHVACALGHALVQRGHSVLFTPTFRLVQELLAAKRNLALPRALRKLDLFDVLILDDIGYVQQSPDEIEVLFTLMAERYERRSLMITSNLVFSDWDRIFKNPMTTVAAIDRLVHHSVILELDVPSFRSPQPKAAKREEAQAAP